jgi:hypothetical protein
MGDTTINATLPILPAAGTLDENSAVNQPGLAPSLLTGGS